MKSIRIIAFTALLMAIIFSFTYYYKDIEAYLGRAGIHQAAVAVIFAILSLAGTFISGYMKDLDRLTHRALSGIFIMIGLVAIYMATIPRDAATWLLTIISLTAFVLLSIRLERFASRARSSLRR